jgi:hypothetical protein
MWTDGMGVSLWIGREMSFRKRMGMSLRMGMG